MKVNFEPMLQIKELRHGKRSAQEESFTAKDVAALEVVVDLFKNTPEHDSRNRSLNAFYDVNSPSSENSLLQASLTDNHAPNSIQVHIAFPYNNNNEDKKRALKPLRLRKVFSAIMSTPVDLEYQIHSFEELTTAPSITVQNILTPGLYLLVENTNITFPEGKFVLKPVKTTPSKLAMRHINDNTEKISSMYTPSVHVEKVSLNQNKEKYLNDKSAHNITNGKTKRSLSVQMKNNGDHDSNIEQRYKNTLKRHKIIDWETIKKHFVHDKVCHCRCKENRTLCRSCAACDAVISKLIFECENLAKYMTQHCTEIQTFFWMNPSGGRKLRDIIHRIDTILGDYYRRVEGKCQGSTGQTITSTIYKRTLKDQNNDQFLNRLHELADDLENASKCKIINDKILISGTRFLNIAEGCFMKNLYKRAYRDTSKRQSPDENIYSLSNIKVNLICNKDFTKPAIVSRNTIHKSFLEKNINAGVYYDYEEIKKSKKNRKSIRDFLKTWSIKKKSRTKNVNQNNTIKRNWRSIHQVNSPLQTEKNYSEGDSELSKYFLYPLEVKFQNKKINDNSTKVPKSGLDNGINIKMRKNKKNCGTQGKHKKAKTNTLISLDSLNHNMKELFKFYNNINLDNILTINGQTGVSTTPTQKITKKVYKVEEIVKKTTNDSSMNKVTIIGNKTVISKVSNKTVISKVSDKNPVTLPTTKSVFPINFTKTGNQKTDKSRTTNGAATPKASFLKIIQSFTLDFLTNKYKDNSKFDIVTTSENRFVRSRIAKYKKHKAKINKGNNIMILQSNHDTDGTSNTVSAILITDVDDGIPLSDETLTTRKSSFNWHSKNKCLKCLKSINHKLSNGTIHDETLKTDNMRNLSKHDDFDAVRTDLKSLNQTLHSKSG